jgi:hypothetical protein
MMQSARGERISDSGLRGVGATGGVACAAHGGSTALALA